MKNKILGILMISIPTGIFFGMLSAIAGVKVVLWSLLVVTVILGLIAIMVKGIDLLEN